MIRNNKFKKGVYYNKAQDNLMIIFKSKTQGMWNRETNEFWDESDVDFYFFSDDEKKVKTIRNVFLSVSDIIEYLGEY